MSEMEYARLPWRAFLSTKNVIVNELYLMSRCPGLYGTEADIGRQLYDKYQALSEKYVVLGIPTTPVVAPKKGKLEFPIELLSPSMGQSIDTVFNVTGHPPIPIPIGFAPIAEDRYVMLPVDMQIAGWLWQEERILRVARSWESHFDWTKVQLSAHEN